VFRKTRARKSNDNRDCSVSEKHSFQNVLSSHENEKAAFSYSSGIKSVFEKLCFRAGLVSRTVGLISSDSVGVAKVYDKQSVMLGVGALPVNGLMGMCRWMGSHFQDWAGYNGVAFSSIFYRVTRRQGSHF